jgi:glycosyltransferase involved in cell wall biosynthesis
MRWIALVENEHHVCCRYRISAFVSWLEAHGYSLQPQRLPHRWWSRLGFYSSLRGQDVILQRKLLPAWEISLLRHLARRLIFDFDDAVFARDSFASKGFQDSRRRRRFAATMRACDAVVAGNTFLAAEAARYTQPDRIHVIPTCVNPDHFRVPVNKANTGVVHLVWIGSSSTLQGLERIAPLLEELGRALPSLRLKVICDRFPHFRHLTVMPSTWSEATETVELASADIGISWIPDGLWSRGKCGLKILQYMAAGLPVVANPVGVQCEMVRHGETGFLADTPAEWLAALRSLAENPGLRQDMGSAGRQRLEADYGVAVGARGWLTLLNELAPRQHMAG